MTSAKLHIQCPVLPWNDHHESESELVFLHFLRDTDQSLLVKFPPPQDLQLLGEKDLVSGLGALFFRSWLFYHLNNPCGTSRLPQIHRLRILYLQIQQKYRCKFCLKYLPAHSAVPDGPFQSQILGLPVPHQTRLQCPVQEWLILLLQVKIFFDQQILYVENSQMPPPHSFFSKDLFSLHGKNLECFGMIPFFAQAIEWSQLFSWICIQHRWNRNMFVLKIHVSPSMLRYRVQYVLQRETLYPYLHHSNQNSQVQLDLRVHDADAQDWFWRTYVHVVDKLQSGY